MKEAYILRVSGEKIPIVPINQTDFSLEELYGYINCELIEVVYLSDNIMIIDEEGKLRGKEINGQATLLYQRDYIVGDVVIMHPSFFK